MNPKVRSRSFDYVAEPDLLVRDKSRQAHPMRRLFARHVVYYWFAFVRHGVLSNALTAGRNRILPVLR
jgi:hypothetical protein